MRKDEELAKILQCRWSRRKDLGPHCCDEDGDGEQSGRPPERGRHNQQHRQEQIKQHLDADRPRCPDVTGHVLGDHVEDEQRRGCGHCQTRNGTILEVQVSRVDEDHRVEQRCYPEEPPSEVLRDFSRGSESSRIAHTKAKRADDVEEWDSKPEIIPHETELLGDREAWRHPDKVKHHDRHGGQKAGRLKAGQLGPHCASCLCFESRRGHWFSWSVRAGPPAKVMGAT